MEDGWLAGRLAGLEYYRTLDTLASWQWQWNQYQYRGIMETNALTAISSIKADELTIVNQAPTRIAPSAGPIQRAFTRQRRHDG